ncbi:hypothetical protein MVLG_04856 [Microbotryum lychnidis-dioicae p1A1 Lamole]|uniref:Calcineurin-like phosphoesterase domain-containing protein n=1 Tax=Microbotryum lychnidis-dioicae (strain p1A1 Lamole / MvSl-1064) TaxID=683840 RepID=U5HCH5_USTV1|nr:hypothetical protein MVLG_04856 [Microbotryum lychnidis-dioicae p1A1 Lamole]|eukprot:KDE04717.1 hypothetical protein MVLG_04856 [Microbotryum lychnidis-dioicae p1A1 Lamole]
MSRPHTDHHEDDDADEDPATALLLLPSLIPSPSSPRAIRRTLSTAIIILFFSVILYEAVLAPSGIDQEQVKGFGWTNYQSVYVGSHDLDSSDGSHTSAKTTTQKEQVETSSKTSQQTQQSVGTFSQLKANTVETMRKQGQLSSYAWHQVINNWNTSIVNAETAAMTTTGPGRLIIVGDVHGTHRSLASLLVSVAYTPTVDTLLHVGDIVSKASLESSLATVQFLRQHNVRGVRGNHDQGVIEWRNWMESYGELVPTSEGDVNAEEGKTMTEVSGHGVALGDDSLEESTPRARKRGWFCLGSSMAVEQETAEEKEEETQEIAKDKEATQIADLEEQGAEAIPGSAESDTPLSAPASFVSGDLLGHGYEWLILSQKQVENDFGVVVPNGWDWGGQWFEIARHLPKDDFEYLRSLPLTLRLEGLDLVLVHAGLVPAQSPHTPLSTYALTQAPATSLSSQSDLFFKPLFSVPTESIPSILQIEQNTLPFTMLNLRTLQLPKRGKGDYGVSKGKKHGTPWSEVWNEVMKTCKESSAAYSSKEERDEEGSENVKKECEPLNVIYGHWAGRGLDIHDYSIGLDSGCVYGKRLSAFVFPLSGAEEAGGAKEGKWRVIEEGFDSGARIGDAGQTVGSGRWRKLEKGFDSGVQHSARGRESLGVRQEKGPVSTAVEKLSEEGTAEATADADEGVKEASDEDDEFQEQDVEFLGRRGAKIVSVSCAKEVQKF